MDDGERHEQEPVERDRVLRALERLDSRLRQVEERIGKVESHLGQMGVEITTRRLVVLDSEPERRLVIETVRGVVELRLLQGRSGAGEASELLLFAASGDEDLGLPAGVGLQLWADGDVVEELTWWSPERRP